MGLPPLSAVPRWIEQVARLLGSTLSLLFRHLLNLLAIWVVVWLAMRAVNPHRPAHRDGRGRRGRQRPHRAGAAGRSSRLPRSLGKVVLIIIGLRSPSTSSSTSGRSSARLASWACAVSFGAQSLVKDGISGFFYLLEGQFAVGDVIEVAGKSGVVERMTLRMVVLRDAQGTVHMVPNGQITTVSNMTRKWSRAVVDVGVAYDTDVDRALAIFRDEAKHFVADPEWLAQFDGDAEVAGVESLGDNAVTIRTLLRTHAGKQWGVAREFRRRIKARLEREGIDIPFPQRTIHVRLPDGAPLAAVPARPPAGGPSVPPAAE
ncbi:MAG: mechanosensitive ion channel family protein [Gemmatimonadetes bacterium]|nr:mechanosensitive ion channel family protein [Gemmatimonadota bacterium]